MIHDSVFLHQTGEKSNLTNTVFTEHFKQPISLTDMLVADYAKNAMTNLGIIKTVNCLHDARIFSCIRIALRCVQIKWTVNAYANVYIVFSAKTDILIGQHRAVCLHRIYDL